MSNINLQILEKYIMNADKSQALESVTPFTETYYYIELMRDLNNSKNLKNLTKRVNEFFENKKFNLERREIIKSKFLLSLLSEENSEQEKGEIMKELNDLFIKQKFLHSKPQKVENTTIISGENKNLKSKIQKFQEERFSSDFLINIFYNDQKLENLTKIPEDKFDKLDLNKIKIENYQIWNFLFYILEWFRKKESVEVIKKLSKIFPDFIRGNIYQIIHKFDLDQLDELMKEDFFLNIQELFKFYFNSKYSYVPENKSTEENRQRLNEILNFLEKQPVKYQMEVSSVRLQLLKLNFESKNFDEEEFLKYLNKPHENHLYLFKIGYKEKQRNYFSKNKCEFLNLTEYYTGSIIMEYLEEILKTSDGYKKYLNFFNEVTLKDLYFSNKLMQGEKISNINSIFSDSKLKEINSKKILTFNEKKNFKKGEKVELDLKIKNIKKLHIRVFEVNTESYLTQNFNGDYKDIKLDSLIPFEEYKYTYPQSKMLIHKEKINFQSITNKKKGVFIIDLIGDELNSRAIIKKGNLTLIYSSVTGRNCVILDQNDEICKSKRTGIYIGNKFFKACESNGVINIPHSVGCISEDIIIISDDFADKGYLKLNDIDFKLESFLVYNLESFMPGLQTKLILQNYLTCNGVKSDLKLLKNVQVVIETMNSNGIEQKQVFKNLELSNDKDLEIDFRIPSKMVNLILHIEAEYKKNGKIEKITSFNSLNFERRKLLTHTHYLDVTLKKNKQKEYIIELIGVNGEKFPNEKVGIEFCSKHLVQYNEFITDNEGKIIIGQLKEISDLNIKVREQNFKDFKFNREEDYFYPEEDFNFLENETFSLPIREEDSSEIYLYQQKDGFKILNCKNNLSIKDKNISIENLKEGSYILYINKNKIYLKVHKGLKKNINGLNIINENYILNLKDKKNALVTEVIEEKENYILNIRGNLENARVHILTSNYKQEFERKINFNESQKEIKYSKKKKKNTYLSEAKLSDELIYVYNRKSKNTYLGNTLDKPGMILKRNKLEMTVELKSIINQGHDFNNLQKCGRLRNYDDCMMKIEENNLGRELFLREFYQNPGRIISNVIPQGNKVVIKKNHFLDQNFIYAIINTKESHMIVEISSEDREVKKIDLRLDKSKDTGFVYRYDRSMDFLMKGNQYNIPHVDKQEYCFIEDVKSFYDSINVLSNKTKDLETFKFLANWDELSPEEKLKKYDKFVSHEINLFLKLKDAEFFEGVVKPFVLNKKEKTLVDYYLLENTEQLKKLACLSNIQNVSPLECVLLISGLKTKYKEISENLLNLLKMKSKLDHISEENKKKKFDSLLSSQKVELLEEEDKTISGGNNKGGGGFGGHQNLLLRGGPMNTNFANFSNTNATFGAPPPPPQSGMLFGSTQNKISLVRENFRTNNQSGVELQNLQSNAINLNAMDFNQKSSIRKLEIFIPLQGTVEYNEKKYYFNSNEKLRSVSVKKFWFDLAEYILKNNTFENFFSENFVDVCNNATNAIAILAFTDLKFKKQIFQSELINNDLKLNPKTNLICLSKEIIKKKGEKGDFQLMIGQHFFDLHDKYKLNELENIRYENPVKEFIKGTIYESTIAVTNPTSTPLPVNIISEIPKGSISIYSLDTSNVKSTILQPLNCYFQSYYFYFPKAGNYSIYPATVVRGGKILGSSKIEEVVEVKEKKTIRDMDTIGDILSSGNVSKIFEFIEKKNILNSQLFYFDDIYWLLKLKSFYEKLIPLLKKRGVYDNTVWSYSIYHKDLETFKEFLNNNSIKNNFRNITYLSNSVIYIDNFEIREYYPLVNPRVHSLNKNNNILNKSFKDTYSKLLEYLFQKGKMTIEDKLILMNYLILQDRLDESLNLYSTINEEELTNNNCKIQYDYLSAYLDFINGYPDFTKAKKICEDYLSFPVLTWRNLFVEIANQLAEFEETDLIEEIIKKEDDIKKNKDKAKTQSSFNCELEKDSIKIVFENIPSVVIKFYKIDLEVYFSMNSFNKSSIKDYTLVQPFSQNIISLTEKKELSHYNYKIPENISKENLFIEISSINESLNKSQYLEYIPFTLNHHVNKEFGIIKLFNKETKKPAPKIYMKCFAKYKNDNIKFYKDGYTDLRGSFDYVSLNKDNLNDISMFRILIISKDFGCKIIETEPPVKIGRVEGEAKKIISKNWVNTQRIRGNQMQKKKGKSNTYQQVYF